jgi:hypothetical protein
VRDDAGGAHYTPEPADTSAANLPEQLQRLVDVLAENVHDAWAATRLDEGWSYGEHVDDTRKKHPCLVPYAELSQQQQDMDRYVVVTTLSKMLALGCLVQPPRVTEEPTAS